MITAVLMLVPPEAYLSIAALAGLLMIIGLRGPALGIFGTLLALALLGPFIEAFVDTIPSWVLALLLLGLFLYLFRLVFGARVAGNVISFLIYDLIRAPFRFMGWLLRGFSPRRRG